ncbi:MAG: NAD(P)-dependent oxidoreductase [SAR202 cluster bacterium]|jgi:nucleoside-diphosphate-sugar epimerase|nr:NAD(P)-dependent oxidoreductase [SAR202 cluster bacterium]MDP6301940.1 NAD(P)-dependent oxidoreductase [SAR202 cluster bacterium]MDP7103994.1 NAD(P)-dependent oxidoreductase [SAR202 cluster bacterium]MDP7225551.1 NAD(P)-dependent oxidoreductase [SAR202 cluster bacterium]MDP7413616.1 NAD(P)-dependent oxidoreductase [SAR202 cluster bacterium]|tara:strand:- start:8250 stop:9191 length:942 start_codon:yes stop_codon:yes gene_type:complete
MAIMVTGGTGFIGGKVICELVDRGEDVVCFDMAPPRANLTPLLDRITVYRGDVTQISHVMDAASANNVHKIIHMAAMLAPDTEERPHAGMFVNIQGMNNILEVARWVGAERVVYASSIAVYGVQERFGDRPVIEADSSVPVTVYGMTKVVNDFVAGKYIDQFGMDVRGVRICTVFGHGRVTGMTGMVGGLLASLPAIGKPVDLPFSPDEPSAMIHAEDAAQIFVRVALADKLNHRTYNSGGHLATVGDMADAVRGFIPDAKITTGETRVPHVYLVDNSQMLADIGYEMAPLNVRILEHINDAKREAGLPEIGG